MFDRTVLALDLGAWSLKLVELRAGLRGVRFERCEELQLPHGVSPEEREATIQLFLEQRNLASDFTLTALPPERATQRHLRFPFSGHKRIAQAVAFEVEETLPLPLDKLVLTHEQTASGSGQTDVFAALAPRVEVEAHLAQVRRLGIEPRVVEMEGAVLGNLSEYLALKDVPRLLLDIGHDNTNLCLLVEGKPVAARSIPCAGRALTEAIALDADLSFEAAELQKHTHGLFEKGSTKPLANGIRLVLDRLTRETLRSLQALVGDGLDSIAPAEIVLTGGSSQIPGLADFLHERSGLPCRVLDLPSGTEGAGALRSVSTPVFAQAAALALRGSSTDRVTHLDFRQDELKYTPDWSGLRPQLQLTIGLFGIAILLWAAMLVSTVWSGQRRVDALEGRMAELYTQVFPGRDAPQEPLEALESELRETRELANHLGVTSGGASVLDVLREISARIPEELEVTLSELRLERFSVQARGYSKDFVSVDRVKEQLQQVPLFDEVIVSDVVTDPRRGGKSFALTIRFGDTS